MTVEEIKDGEKLQLKIFGRIDTVTSQKFQDTLLKAFQRSKTLILDFTGVDYVSSAGLRALILGQKTAESKGGSMVLIHVNDGVKDIFRVTGFNKVLTVQ